jgi:RNA polymerase sigma-70 factor (ECF subfamily)
MAGVTANAWVGELAQRHLDAAYNLGRWLLGNDQDAADAVHDAYVRAARAAHTYAGGNARAWWLAIVRNCCLAKLSTRGRERPLDEETAALPRTAANEVEDSVDAASRARIAEHLRALPEIPPGPRCCASSKICLTGIADVLELPIGTVMSRLSAAVPCCNGAGIAGAGVSNGM